MIRAAISWPGRVIASGSSCTPSTWPAVATRTNTAPTAVDAVNDRSASGKASSSLDKPQPLRVELIGGDEVRRLPTQIVGGGSMGALLPEQRRFPAARDLGPPPLPLRPDRAH